MTTSPNVNALLLSPPSLTTSTGLTSMADCLPGNAWVGLFLIQLGPALEICSPVQVSTPDLHLVFAYHAWSGGPRVC